MNKPDIVFINCHDLGRRLRIYGESNAHTPGLNRLAKEGVVFENAFSTSTMCSPSRGSIATGRYPHQIGLFGLTNRGWDLCEQEKALPGYLAKAGYHTVLFGLQHESRNANRLGYKHIVPRPQPHPTPVWGLAAQVADYLKELKPRDQRAPVYVNVGIFEPHRHDFWEHYNPIADEKVKVPGYLPDTKGVRRDLARYDGLIEAMDQGVSTILTALDAAALARETLVLFTTDHGIAFPRAKTTVYDAGIGVSALARWPAQIAAGKRTDALVSHTDWLPTLLEILDVEIPEKVCGHSFLPVLLGRSEGGRDAIYAEGTYHVGYNPMRCVRTRKYKLIRNYHSQPDVSSGVDRDPNNGILAPEEYSESFREKRPPWELFDIEQDPCERHNLVGESRYEQIQSELKQKLEDWLTATNDPIHQMYAAATEGFAF